MANAISSHHLNGFVDFLFTNNLLADITTPQQILLAAKQCNVSLIPYLITYNLLDTKTIATASAKYFGLRFVDLASYKPNDFALEMLNNQLIIKYHVLPVGRHPSYLELAISDPTNAIAINAIKFHTAREVKPIVAEYDKLEHWITVLLKQKACTNTLASQCNSQPNNQCDNLFDNQYLYPSANNTSLIDTINSRQQLGVQQLNKQREIPQGSPQSDLQSSAQNNSQSTAQDSSIIKLVDRILERAIAQNASDIHFEPYETNYRVRLRIDGILYPEKSIIVAVAQRLSSRLKVMAKLDIAERRLPQDGRFALTLNNSDDGQNSDKSSTINRSNNDNAQLDSKRHNKRDCRISTCPTMFGEKIVIRILNSTDMNLDTAHLGFTAAQEKIFLKHINAPQGMILVTGPTGSGKTITLYTALSLLNTSDQNISTVEDPCEINLPGINQVEINTKIGLNFATVLRTFLRQDPDIIMVGEIRDAETAQIAIKAAQTGHLVLSTLHTNSAAETITRLLNMDIATFNLVGALKLLIAQRLVRKLCPQCKEPCTISAKVLQEHNLNPAHILNIQVSNNQVSNGQTNSAQTNNDQANNNQVNDDLTISKQPNNDLTNSCQTNNDQTNNDQTNNDQKIINQSSNAQARGTQVNNNLAIFRAHAAGCAQCKNGYRGRAAIFELLSVSTTISTMILNRCSSLEIEQQALREGMLDLRTAAWQRVFAGETSIEEINRVVL